MCVLVRKIWKSGGSIFAETNKKFYETLSFLDFGMRRNAFLKYDFFTFVL